MDYRKTDKTKKMVKVTIKRADDSTEDKKWVCKRIDDDLESAIAVETVPNADESLQAEDENSNDETKYADDWYQTVPSYLEIEMKEEENQEPSNRSSTENNANISMTHRAVSSRETVDSAGMSCNDPMDLSASHSKLESRRDITNVSYKCPSEASTSKSKFLGNVYDEGHNAPSLTGADRIIKSEPASYLPRTMWSQNTPPIAIQRQMNSGNALALETIGIPSTSYNFQMSQHAVFPVSSGFVNTKKSETTVEGNIPHHQTQDTQSHQGTDYRPFSSGTVNYGQCSDEPHSKANRYHSWPSQSEDNGKAIPFRNVFAERTGDKFVNKIPQNTNNLKRPSENCAERGSNEASKSVCPPRKKKSHAEVPNTANYCKPCHKTFKSELNYKNHCATRQHIIKANESIQRKSQQSNLHNFQPNSEGRSLGPTDLQAQQLPLPLPYQSMPIHYLQSLQFQMWNHMMQARAIIPADPSGSGKEKKNNTEAQKSAPGTSKIDYNEQPLGHIGLQNYFGMPMNLPVSHTNNPQGFFLPLIPQSESPMMANPKFLENKAFHSSRPPQGISATSFQKSKDVPSMTHHQEDVFRIYHCMVCSIYKTDYLHELEQHINADRSRTPLELVIPTNECLVCKLCDFKSRISTEMAQHCTTEFHLKQVRYYNHVREGGLHRTKHIFTDIHKPFWVFCNACDYIIESMALLKAHASSPNHLSNVSGHLYIESFNRAIEYCFCRLCCVKTLTKKELREHARSKEHKEMFHKYPTSDSYFANPRNIFFIKALDKNESPRVSEQYEGSTFIGKEKPHMRKEKNEERKISENLASVNLRSASSTPLQPLPVSCSLCQQVFPEINVLVQHLQRLHGVNEAGVKWFVSAICKDGLKLHEEKSSPKTELTDTRIRKVKSITVWPEKYFSTNEILPTQRMNNNSSSYQSSVVAEQSEESESSRCSKAIRSGQNVTTDENLNQERRNSSTSSSQQFNEPEHMRDADKVDQNTRLNQYRRTCTDPSSSQEIYKAEGIRNPDLHQERMVNIASTSRQQFCKTENIQPEEEKNVPKSEERLSSYSSQDEINVVNESEPNEDSKYEIEMNDPSSDQFSPTAIGSLISHSVLNTNRESYDSSSIDDIAVPIERLPTKEKTISNVGRSMETDTSSSQHDALDYQNRRSSLEYQPNLNLRRNAGSYSPTNNLMAFVEPNQTTNNSDNILIKIKIPDDSVTDRMELNAHPNESEAQIYAQNLPAETDPQTQATKSIENIEISNVFSLNGHIDTSNTTDDEDDETSDFDIYSDI